MKKLIWKQQKSQYRKITFTIAAVLILTAIVIAGIFIYDRACIGVNKGDIGFCLQDGKLLVSWQTISDKNKYRFSRYDEELGEYIFCGDYVDGRAELTDIVPGQELKLKMQGVRTVSVFGCDREIVGKKRILTVVPEQLESPVLTKTADTAQKSMTLTWDAQPDNWYEVFLMNEEGILALYTETENGEITFHMEDHAELSGREQALEVAVRAVRRTDDYVLYGVISDLTEINRADLMESELKLQYEDYGENRYVLKWQESKGDWYELQEWSSGDKRWVSRQVYQWSDILSYDTGRLPSCTEMRFRVITYHDTDMRDREEYAAIPSELTFRTMLSPVYCTIWPLAALDFTEEVSGENVTGQVPAGKALCVLEETEGRFLVRYEDKYGYIDSRYCLIDLTEYLGNLCEYNITNSYSSIFRVHGYDIPEVTDSVIQGYENIYMQNGEMLVPYLYPCAQKLYKAALHAQEDGYFLCIYDAFRPNEATRYLYDTTETIINMPVVEKDSEEEGGLQQEGLSEETKVSEEIEEPESKAEDADDEEVLTEKIMFLLEELEPDSISILRGLSQEALLVFYALAQESLVDTSSEAQEPLDENITAALSLLTPEDLVMLQSFSTEDVLVLKELSWEELEALKLYVDNTLTYLEVMTDNRFRLGSFLAQTVSTHNRGIALDLTLVSAASKEELEMQSDMHDLSWNSILAQNNENADLLSFYMKEAGYNDLVSEWWHFQDDETRSQLNLGYLERGVSPEGWKKDELGWKYRLTDGSYYYAGTVMIDQKERTFNGEGYLVEE